MTIGLKNRSGRTFRRKKIKDFRRNVAPLLFFVFFDFSHFFPPIFRRSACCPPYLFHMDFCPSILEAVSITPLECVWVHYCRWTQKQQYTNNILEGWYRRFNTIVAKHHPNIYEFLEMLNGEQAHTDTLVEQLIAGQQLQQPRMKVCMIPIKSNLNSCRIKNSSIILVIFFFSGEERNSKNTSGCAELWWPWQLAIPLWDRIQPKLLTLKFHVTGK